MKYPPIPKSIGKYPLGVFGHKARVLDNILDLVPPNTDTFCDLFACTGVVGREVKRRFGSRIVSNDIRRHAYLQNRSLVENNGSVLSDEHNELLSRPNRNKEHHARRCYRKILGERNADFLDTWAANIPLLDDPLIQHIAAFAPVVAIAVRLKFASQNYTVTGELTGGQTLTDVDVAKETLCFTRQRMPDLLCDNGKRNEVHNEDAVTLISQVDADVAYFDSPYVCRGGRYTADMKFVEALSRIMTGEGGSITDPYSSKLPYPPFTDFSSRGSAVMGFSMLFRQARHIPRLIVSYNTSSDILPTEIVRLAQMQGWDAAVAKTIEYFRPTVSRGGNTETDEVLIVCRGRGTK